MTSPSILVPTDLSEASDKAFTYASMLAKLFNLPINLMHVVEVGAADGPVSQKFLANNFLNRQIKKQLEDIAAGALKSDNIVVNPLLIEGNIFDAIGKCAIDCNAKFIVLGTHGIKGVQHITGAFISRVLQNCKAPALIVQKDSLNPPFKNVVMPCNALDSKINTDDLKLSLVEKSNANMHVVFPTDKEEFLFYNQLVSDDDLKAQFSSMGLTFSFNHISDWNGANYADRLLDYAESINATLIFIKRKGDKIQKEDETIITNNLSIPVFIF